MSITKEQLAHWKGMLQAISTPYRKSNDEQVVDAAGRSPIGVGITDDYYVNWADLDFMVAASEAVLALLAEVERLQQLEEAVRYLRATTDRRINPAWEAVETALDGVE